MPAFGRQVSAHRQADEIVGVRHGMSFVEVVDAPDQTSFDVAPGAEILYVQVAHRQHVRPLGKIGTHLRPDLRPAVVGGSQKGKDRRLHVGVLEAQIFLDQIGAMAEPLFKLAGRFDDVHSARNDSGAEDGSQRVEQTQDSTRRRQLPGVGEGWFALHPTPGNCGEEQAHLVRELVLVVGRVLLDEFLFVFRHIFEGVN